MITLKQPNKYALHHICQNLRAIDRQEIYPLLPYDSASLLAEYTFQACENGFGKIIWKDGIPATIVGLQPLHGKVCWQVFAFGTDDWRDCIFQSMRGLRECIRDVLRHYPEAMRMQADSHEKHTEAHAWIKRLHGVKEAEMPFYGRDNATYYRFSWIVEGQAFKRYIEEKPCADQVAHPYQHTTPA